MPTPVPTDPIPQAPVTASGLPPTPALRARWRWLPAQCEVCGCWPTCPAGQAVCGDCVQAFTHTLPRCPTCALPLPPQAACRHCRQHPPGLTHCVAALDYAYPWHTPIQRFKFQGEVAWADLFAQWMWQAPSAQALLDACDWWLPLPLSPRRLGERGYNQSWELLKHIAQRHTGSHTPSQAHSDWLIKLGDTPDQHSLDRSARLHNLGSAFSASPKALPHLTQRHVLLVDDVMTTGATLQAAALALRRAGATQVSALVLARTPAPQ